MYCPGCATKNLDEAKFCRVCGVNLASVAQALADQPSSLATRDTNAAFIRNAHDRRTAAMKKFMEGGGLLAGSGIIGAALGIFSNQREWIMMWLVFGAWLAVVGVLFIAKGFGSLIESRYISQELEQMRGLQAALSEPVEFQDISTPVTNPRLTPVTSITEHTTELLNQDQATKR